MSKRERTKKLRRMHTSKEDHNIDQVEKEMAEMQLAELKENRQISMIEIALHRYKFERSIKKMDVTDILREGDHNFDKIHSEVFASLADSEQYQDFGPLLDLQDTTPIDKQIFDQKSSFKARAYDEIKLKYYEMKWRWYKTRNYE